MLAFPSNIQSQHLVATYKMLLTPLSIPLSETAPRLYLAPKEIEDARILLHQCGVPEHAFLAERSGDATPFIIGINPGATYGSAKCWLPERFREVTERLL